MGTPSAYARRRSTSDRLWALIPFLGEREMFRSMQMMGVAVLLMAVLSNAALAAADAGTHEGTVVKAGEGKLVMTDKDGKEHSHAVAAAAKVTLGGKEAKLADLKKGDKVKVTTDDTGKVSKVDATREEKKK